MSLSVPSFFSPEFYNCVYIKEIQLGQKPGLGTNKVVESLMEASQDECEIISDVLKYCHCL